MQIAHKEDVSVLLQLLYHALRMVHSRVKFLGGIDPAPVQVNACQVAPRAPIDNTVDVEHGHYLEHEVVSQDLRLQKWPRQVVNDSFHHPGGARLTWMDSRRYHDALTRFNRLWVALESRDDKHVTVVASNGLAEGFAAHPILSLRVTLELIEVATHIGEGVGVRVGEVDNVRVVFKSDRPRKRVVVPCILASHRILVVADVEATANPAFAGALSLIFRVDERAHPVVVEGVGLHKVDNIEAVLLASPRVAYSEVVPLTVAPSVVVWLQY